MNIELTRDAQKAAAKLYKEYLNRVKSGQSKHESKKFSDEELTSLYADEHPMDFQAELQELIRVFAIQTNIWDDITLSDSFIIHMENKFKDSLKDVLSFLSQFIP